MRKIAAVLLFATVVLSVWMGGNLYLARRLVVEPAWPAPIGSILWWGLALLVVLPIVQPLAERAVGARRSRWIAWPGYFYMGVALLLLVGLGATDLILALSGTALGAVAAPSLPETAVPRAQAIVVALAALGAGGVGLVGALRPPRLRCLAIELERWPTALDGFRIIQISDIHIGAMIGREFAEQIVARVNAEAADLVVVTGDLVDGTPDDLEHEVAPFAGLRAAHGVHFVTGNHDYYSGADPWIAHVRAFGWRVLRNERVAIERGGAGFDLAGVDDHRADLFGGDHGEDVPRAVAGRDPGRALILLAHDPTTFKKACRLGVDLQLSGHTHGGQIWPFGYFVRLVVTFLAGEYEREGAKLVVSRGTGYWGPPIRLGSPAEIVEITLRSPAAVRSGATVGRQSSEASG